jgi:two-component system sensor histidine kinase MtrB
VTLQHPGPDGRPADPKPNSPAGSNPSGDVVVPPAGSALIESDATPSAATVPAGTVGADAIVAAAGVPHAVQAWLDGLQPKPARSRPMLEGGWVGLRRRFRPIGDRFAPIIKRFLAAWRGSLQLRVGITTLAVTAVVVLIVGIVLVNEIGSGVLRAKRNAAIAQAESSQAVARQILSSVPPNDYAGVNQANVQMQSELGTSGDSGFTVQLESTSGVSVISATAITISPAMRRQVQDGNLVVQYAPVPAPGAAQGTVAGLIVGEPIAGSGGVFELYYLFPLTAEQSTIALVQRTVLFAGLFLVLFVAAIALLVTRQVVRPVRVAAETAAKLAAGDLSQRIRVQGTDDLARLGQSFNDMAGSLQRQIRRLEELSRLQRRFTSDVSHELRTPLTTIRMATELLHSQRGDFSPELARSAELLQTELDRFEALLGDLLEISRYDAGAAHLEAEVTDLRAAVDHAVDGSRLLAERQGSELVVNTPDEPVLVEMDSRRVERILRNLIDNAVDHGQSRPVVITVAMDDQAAAVTVRDHGVGLRPGESGLVFNRFWRGDPSRSRLTGGTGLGLAISLEDARLHGGWLQAWGERGLGAQFRLTLPLRAAYTLTSSPLPLEPEALIDLETS